jgi:tudor domain-containing protein 1/4/6/7
LQLPWTSGSWNLCVTNPVNTNEVWACLIGPDYSDLLSTLRNDIKLSMETDKSRALRNAVGDIRLVCDDAECWSRVRIEKIGPDKLSYYCFHIDQGDCNWFPISDLFKCESRFLELPAQAVVFSLYQLEDFTVTKILLMRHLKCKPLNGVICHL